MLESSLICLVLKSLMLPLKSCGVKFGGYVDLVEEGLALELELDDLLVFFELELLELSLPYRCFCFAVLRDVLQIFILNLTEI